MKKIYLLTILSTLLLVTVVSISSAQTLRPIQWASTVIGFSSEYAASPGNYSAAKALGAPDVYPNCGDNINAWLSASADVQREFLILGYTSPQVVNTIRICQTLAPGAIDTVYLRDAANGTWHQVYQATATDAGLCPGGNSNLLEITIPSTSYNVDAVRIAVNSPAVGYYNEIDAVGIANFDIMTNSTNQYATSVIGFSSEYTTSPGSYSAAKALGAPSLTLSTCGDNAEAWASLTAEGQREFLVLGYANPAIANRLLIYQNVAPGAIDTVYLRDASNGTWHQIYTATAAATLCPTTKVLEINFTKTTYLVDAIRIAVNSPAVSYWNEIDAVALQCNLPAGIYSQQNGDWNIPATWVGGVVPTTADIAIVSNGHNVTLAATGNANGLYVVNGGNLSVANTATLNIGPANGGNRIAEITGTLINSGNININGRLQFNAGSTFTMGGGNLVIDGNDGTAVGSVLNVDYMLNCATGMLFNLTGGTVQFTDPAYGANGWLINCPYNFGNASILKFGNGTSVTAGGNTSGFIIDNGPAQLGTLIIDASTTAANRRITFQQSNTTCNGNLNITTGHLQNNSNFTVTGTATNNSLFTINGITVITGTITNNGTTTTTAGSLSTGGDFINNTGSVYNVTAGSYTSVNGNITNNGSFTSNWLYFSNNFGVGNNAQTIGGAGTFNIYGIDIFNSNSAGVTPLVPLTVQDIYIAQGKFFLGNNNLTYSGNAGGNYNNSNYFVLNGTGKLRYTNLTTTEILFPVGTATSYNPVKLNNGNGHTFSCTVKTGFTISPAGTDHVNREWNITDETGGAVSATLTLQWNAADENAGFNRTNCGMIHYNGSNWIQVGGTAPAAGTNPYTKTITGVTAFSPFGITSNAAALPVDMVLFNAAKENNSVLLNWNTENEINLLRYDVEKSTDGRIFIKLTETPAKGNSNNAYTSTDDKPVNGINYYRLKIIDKDGSYRYSIILKVDFTNKYLVSILPNPAHDYIIINGADKFKRVQLVDINGKLVKQFITNSSNRFNTTGIPQGVYILQLINDDERQVQKIIIQ